MSVTLFNERKPSWTSVMDDFFNDSLFKSRSISSNWPSVNIIDGENSYKLTIALPGYNKENVNLKVEGNLLTIYSEKETKDEIEEKKYSRKEYSYESFSRSFTLPSIVNSSAIEANFENGELIVILPKDEEESTSKDIKIQ